ncbi:VOC family protein [Streptomyces sp. NPDC029041]|uniref:VOC family protein n=1 Tax=Streptomyces sp. NPDC029041 TaxID=3155727 RepID=UPI0033E1B6D0
MRIRWTYAFIDRPREDFGAACDFWTAVTGTRLSELRGAHDEFVTLLPDDADACVKVQAVGPGSGGAHLDFCVDDVTEFAAAAVRLGAGVVADLGSLVVLRSPGGQSFCADPWRGQSSRPGVVRGSRLDQVCVDVPSSAYEGEVAFWSALLDGWESLPGSLPEFHVVEPPPGLPVRLLLQRLGDERPASAHLDLACADVTATRAHHERLGAAFVAGFSGWTVMRDPSGGTYCLTTRDPVTGRSRGQGVPM